MAGDVVEEFKKGEGFEYQDEGAHDDGESEEEAAEKIQIDDVGKAGRGKAGQFGESVSIFGAWKQRGSGFDAGLTAAEQAPEGAEAGPAGEGGGFAAIPFEARKKSEADESEKKIGTE